MTATAAHIVDEFKRLTPAEQREVSAAIAQATAAPAGQPRKSIADLPTFRPLTDMSDLKPHDRYWAEAILASKNPPADE